MSDSRLEKFIYAICSMDVSDLPVPLSRIEKLWNCLITGETPDFEPLSRNEKYLMAMLDRYDISNLPAPMSRGEKLLYKIAMGETDLSDVPGYLSRYEELLKYLIKNGEISEDDFEYILYTLNQSLSTLYQTVEKPVKSAILKGNTLINLFDGEKMALNESTHYTYSNGIIQCDVDGSAWTSKTNLSNAIKPNTKYLLKGKNVGECPLVVQVRTDLSKLLCSRAIEVGRELNEIITTEEKIDGLYVKVYPQSDSDGLPAQAKINIIEYQDGMENWDIPYFEGMQSVKMPVLTTTGKNLFDKEKFIDKNQWSADSNGTYRSISLQLEPNTVYTMTRGSISCAGHRLYVNVSNHRNSSSGSHWWLFHHSGNFNNQKSFTTNKTGIIYFNSNTVDLLKDYKDLLNEVQLEKGDTVTSYEPFKSNILSVNEDVELRGIGDVKDELNLLTGEVTERIGEYTIDGNENWEIHGYFNVDGYKSFVTTITGLNNFYSGSTIIISGDFKSGSWNDYTGKKAEEMVWNHDPNKIGIKVKNETASNVEELKAYLASNPITFQYELATESIKTVDLTVVDQDNQPTELGTFENVTHVSLVAENLIPEVELKVATNLLEDMVLFTLTDAFNTLYPTAEKPVKSAILKGNTLINISNAKGTIELGPNKVVDSESDLYKNLTTYTIIFNAVTNGLNKIRVQEYMKQEYAGASKDYTIIDGLNKFTYTTSTSNTFNNLKLRNFETGGDVKLILSDLMIIEGDYTNVDIPFFEGMQSVKMPVLTTTGKNLFNMNKTIDAYLNIEGGIVTPVDAYNKLSDYIEIKPNTTYVYSHGGFTIPEDSRLKTLWTRYYTYDENKTKLTNGTQITESFSLTTPTNAKYIRIGSRFLGLEGAYAQIEEGSTATIYEPYKSNILSTPSDLELRGIGEVKDELDCLTGELTERIGEVVLDGSENWIRATGSDNKELTSYFRIDLENSYTSSKAITDKFMHDNGGTLSTIEHECYRKSNDLSFYINVFKSRLASDDVGGFKAWLSQNPLIVQYELETESVKTVDLTTVNQDGNVTTLKTFDDTTHVLLQSKVGPNPGASLTVKTKIPSASSTSLLMNDILTNQQQLETTVDEQSENADATMIATTEIFEETL